MISRVARRSDTWNKKSPYKLLIHQVRIKTLDLKIVSTQVYFPKTQGKSWI